jgi:DNA polymerase I-like protein with 3'-5' exonuclease and polymerase domains
MEYEEFMKWYESKDPAAYEKRQMGKLTNLSGNYRIGANSLAKKAFEEYDIPMQVQMGWYVLNTFQTRYDRIPVYWNEAISLAKANGYAQTFSGRRYKIHDWGSRKTWMSESSALMFPIQGGGADMKGIAVAEIYENAPDSSFALDLHDATFVYVPEDRAEEQKMLIDDILRNVDYRKYWGIDLPIKLTYESKMGSTFADVK